METETRYAIVPLIGATAEQDRRQAVRDAAWNVACDRAHTELIAGSAEYRDLCDAACGGDLLAMERAANMRHARAGGIIGD